MKTRRWMKTVLNEARKEPTDMPWSRKVRAARRVAKPRFKVAAE